MRQSTSSNGRALPTHHNSGERGTDMKDIQPEYSSFDVLDEEVFQSVKQQKSDPVVRANNRRALGIHFALSVAGLVAAMVLQSIMSTVFLLLSADGSFSSDDMLVVPVAIIGGSLIYVLCGYLFLKPTKEKAWRSVSWLATMTIASGAFAAMSGAFLWLAELLNLGIGEMVQNVFAIPIALQMFFNTMAFGVVVTFSYLPLPNVVVALLCIVIIPVLPPGLLYAGLRLKMRRQGNADSVLE
ncbi:MAG: hypothetical protein FWF11_02370 [Coriobacteriia bacterium]|nr:hypothetical protein [Coriobacteriia bacterium]